jgi:hypothetical protein
MVSYVTLDFDFLIKQVDATDAPIWAMTIYRSCNTLHFESRGKTSATPFPWSHHIFYEEKHWDYKKIYSIILKGLGFSIRNE